MEDNFTRDEFEEFLQDQVKNHRMYPNDTVWREINKKLHGDKKWPALTIAALAFISASIVISVHFTQKTNIFAIKPSIEPVSTSSSIRTRDNVLNKLTSSDAFAEGKSNTAGLATGEMTPKTEAANNLIKTIGSPNQLFAEKEVSSYIEKSIRPEKVWGNSSAAKTKPAVGKLFPADLGSVELTNQRNEEHLKDPSLAGLAEEKLVEKKLKISAKPLSSQLADNDKNMVDKFLKEQGGYSPQYAREKISKSKFSFQIYAAPSISYRKLLEDQAMLKTGKAGPVGLNYVTDVNNVVRHKPGAGIEVGLSFMYNLSDKFRIKSGFQFNVRQYSIEAYRSSTEVASIALIRNNGFDTVNTIALYRNNNGYYSAELVNRYYQLAVPLGVEWEILGNRRIQFNVAATIQPTYLLNRNAYLLSTNFKNYTESPEMIRRWNINSNIETFVSFKSGDFKWQIGPQIRYQPYSTFIPQYPIREHLLDYGIKVGVLKSIR